MKKKYKHEILSFITGISVGIILCMLLIRVGCFNQEFKYIGNIVEETECAQYNPDTGEFEWLK